MGKEKKVENYYMRVEDFAYDPVMIGGTYYVRVANVHDTKLKSVHIGTDLSLTATTMPKSMIEKYTPVLLRNAAVLKMGL